MDDSDPVVIYLITSAIHCINLCSCFKRNGNTNAPEEAHEDPSPMDLSPTPEEPQIPGDPGVEKWRVEKLYIGRSYAPSENNK
jgi:hypothetical protein